VSAVMNCLKMLLSSDIASYSKFICCWKPKNAVIIKNVCCKQTDNEKVNDSCEGKWLKESPKEYIYL